LIQFRIEKHNNTKLNDFWRSISALPDLHFIKSVDLQVLNPLSTVFPDLQRLGVLTAYTLQIKERIFIDLKALRGSND
jgi:hypothetical protein